MVVEQLAGLAVIGGRHGAAAGDHQSVLGGGDAALRRYPGEGGARVLLEDVDAAAAAVGPDNLAAVGVERVDEDAHEGPDAGGEIDLAVVDYRCAARRPHTHEPVVADDPAVIRAAAELPQERPGLCVQTIEAAIVASEEELVLVGGGGEAHGAVRVEPPPLFARLGAVGGQAVGGRGRHEDRLAHDHGLIGGVELELGLAPGPGGPGRRQVSRPLKVQAGGQSLRAYSRPAGVMPPHGPVVTLRIQGERGAQHQASEYGKGFAGHGPIAFRASVTGVCQWRPLSRSAAAFTNPLHTCGVPQDTI